jgi:AraC-like DNA-binding protein
MVEAMVCRLSGNRLSVLRECGINPSESDILMTAPRLLPFETRKGRTLPVTAAAMDYGPKELVKPHRHAVGQLIYAVRGVMVVSAAVGQWVVPATRALWMPATMVHAIRMVGHVRMRTIYVRPDSSLNLPTACAVVAVSTLLRTLILEAVTVQLPYADGTRDGRLMRLLLDEIFQMPVLPLHLPTPSDPRLKVIHDKIKASPDDPNTITQWARQFRLNPRTIQRLFLSETGFSFGQWRRQARLLAALEMLARGERIVDIALAVGYSSPTAFSTMFRRQFGAPPSSYFYTKLQV